MNDTQTNTQTHTWTFWLIESIGPEGRCFENLLCGLHYPLKTRYANLNYMLSWCKVNNYLFNNISVFSCEKTTNIRKRHFVWRLKKIINHFAQKIRFFRRCPIKHKNTIGLAKCFIIFLYQYSWKWHFLPFIVFSHKNALMLFKAALNQIQICVTSF